MAIRLRAASTAILALVLLVAPAPAGALSLAPELAESALQPAKAGAELIVGFHHGVSSLVITLAGGTLVAQSSRLALAVVTAADPAATALVLSGDPTVAFVEKNGPVRGAASGWDASGWDASGWDASGWDASGWDASGWDASGWDASGWDASGWDASGWDTATLTAAGRAGKADGASGDPLFAKQWGLRATRGVQARELAAGAAATVCVVDSGVDAKHPDLASRMWRDAAGRTGYDFVGRDHDPADDAGHGTHVAGIAAAASRNGAGIMGASPARIMAVKVLDASGVGTEADLAFGIDWCNARGAKVVSLSLGTPEHSPSVKRAVERATRDGVVLVASIGNAGKCYDCVRFPAAYPEVIGVGALQPDGKPAPFSSVSWEVDLAAPGVAIVSTFPGDRYAAMNGTSQAVPHVSATAAMMLAADPALTPAQVREHLAASARDLGPAGKDPYVGHGALDAEAALRRVL